MQMRIQQALHGWLKTASILAPVRDWQFAKIMHRPQIVVLETFAVPQEGAMSPLGADCFALAHSRPRLIDHERRHLMKELSKDLFRLAGQ